MRRPGTTIIPDSEDDAAYSETSLKNSSPPHDVNALQLGGSSLSRSRSTHVIEDSEGDDDLSFNVTDPVSNRTRNRVSANVEVVIPAKTIGSPSDSSRSSWRGPSADETTGFNTPATSVGAAPESDKQKHRSRVNASERVSRLRSSTISRNSQRGTRRSAAALSADEVDNETADADAALAHALQMEEYEQPATKKQKTSANRGRGLEEELEELPDIDLTESELSDRLTPLPSLSPEPDFLYTVDDSEATEDEGFEALMNTGSHRRRALFNQLSHYGEQEDEDGTLLTWEEQRKKRRVSRSQPRC